MAPSTQQQEKKEHCAVFDLSASPAKNYQAENVSCRGGGGGGRGAEDLPVDHGDEGDAGAEADQGGVQVRLHSWRRA